MPSNITKYAFKRFIDHLLCNGLAARLQLAKERAKYTEQNLAKAVGMSRPALSSLLAGRSRNPLHLPALARALNVDEDWLHFGYGPGPMWMQEMQRPTVILMYRMIIENGDLKQPSSANEWIKRYEIKKENGRLTEDEKEQFRVAYLELQSADLRSKLFSATKTAEPRPQDEIPLHPRYYPIVLQALKEHLGRAKEDDKENIRDVIESVLARHYPGKRDDPPSELSELTGRQSWTFSHHLHR